MTTLENAPLQWGRVQLRPLTNDDVPDLQRWLNAPDVGKYLATSPPSEEIDARRWLEQMNQLCDGSVVFVIVDTECEKPIGITGIHDVCREDGRAKTGTLIGESDYQGRGYGTEAKMLLLYYAFTELKLRKICSLVFGFNQRSIACNARCGYRIEGILKDHYVKDGRYCDEILMAIFESDWLPVWERFLETGKV